MSCELIARPKRLRATSDVTDVGPLASMSPNVYTVSTALCIRLIASFKGTHERLFTSVNANMHQNALMAFEYSTTVIIRANILFAALGVLSDYWGFPLN